MSYMGLVPGEHSSGDNIRRLSITKAGNSEVRRVLTQTAWSYRFPARVSRDALEEYNDAQKSVRHVAWKAQVRLCERYRRLTARGKRAQVRARTPWSTALANCVRAFASAKDREIGPVIAATAMQVLMARLETTAIASHGLPIMTFRFLSSILPRMTW
jgi:hypothetical protein